MLETLCAPESVHKDIDQSCVAFVPIEEKALVGPWVKALNTISHATSSFTIVRTFQQGSAAFTLSKSTPLLQLTLG
jgi:hypothetical protein